MVLSRRLHQMVQATMFGDNWNIGMCSGMLIKVTLLGGAELRGDKGDRTYAKRFGYDDVTGNSAMPVHPNPQVEDVKRYADLIDQLSGEVSSESRFASFYASLDYSYLKHYLLSVTFRQMVRIILVVTNSLIRLGP